MACLNTALNWTCSGGYLKVYVATWRTANDCNRTSFTTPEVHTEVVMYLQNECDNKTTCAFTVGDSNFGGSCVQCSRLDYYYTCLGKSLVVLH